MVTNLVKRILKKRKKLFKQKESLKNDERILENQVI